MKIDVGTVLSSRYRAATLLGKGGMGEVWACFDLEEKRTVAVKVVRAEYVADAAMRRLFQAEVVAVARLTHPGIVDVYDLLALPDGTSLLVMAFRPGKPLGKALKDHGSWGVIRTVLIQLLQALAHAHARSVLHLDLKPDNVIVRMAPSVQTTLVDFGIARLLSPGRGAESWFDDGSIIGTPEYMAPEQAFGEIERLGPWTDLYSVGLLAHELCSKRLPFEDVEPDQLAAAKRRAEDPAPPLQPVVAGVPDAFVELCAALLELDPWDRPACAADVVAALEEMEGDALTVMLDEPTPSVAPARAADNEVSTPSETVRRLDIPAARDSSPGSTTGRSATGRSKPLSARFRATEGGTDSTAVEVPPTPGAYGLFGLRELPVVGRVEERRALWDALRATTESQASHAVLLSGPAGTGKSRLARDAVERALELGVAIELHTHWSAGGSADEGLRGLVENALGSRGSKGAAFEARLAFFLERFPDEGTSALAREARVLLRPAPDAAPDAALPVRVARDVVVRAATNRPVVLRLDDVHWSRGECAALIEALGKVKTAFGVCIVATERDGEAAEDYKAALQAGAKLSRVSMQPLGSDATRAMVRGLLDLDDDLAALVARRSEGNPLFARQLVTQLVLERAVEKRGRRYALVGGVDAAGAVPSDMGAVWSRNVKVSGADPTHLAVLALVRERVSAEVVDSLAELVGESFTDSFNRSLAAGLVRQEGELFAFSHGLLRDYLLGINHEDAPRLHGVAADALRVLVGREDVEEERARHLHAAGRHRQALDAMLSASIWSWRRAEREPRRRRLEQLIEWAKPRPDGVSDHARALAELAQCHVEGGNVEEANRCLEESKRVLALAKGHRGYESAAAWVGLRESQTFRLQGRTPEGADAMERSIEHARRAQELEVEAICLGQRGLDAFRRGDHSSAATAYDAALALARRAENRATEAQVLMAMSGLKPAVEMEALARDAVQMAGDAGALRIEIFARLTWLEALFQLGEKEQARSEGRKLSLMAQHRGLRQIVAMAEGNAACWAVIEEDWALARAHRDLAEAWGVLQGAAPERATAAAVSLGLALHEGDEVGAKEWLELLVRHGRTYREPHFDSLVMKLLTMAPQSAREALELLDAASPRA